MSTRLSFAAIAAVAALALMPATADAGMKRGSTKDAPAAAAPAHAPRAHAARPTCSLAAKMAERHAAFTAKMAERRAAFMSRMSAMHARPAHPAPAPRVHARVDRRAAAPAPTHKSMK